MKTLSFDLKITFSEKIKTDEEIKEIMENVAKAIQDKCEMDSIAPWESDIYTESVTINDPFSEQSVTLKIAD